MLQCKYIYRRRRRRPFARTRTAKPTQCPLYRVTGYYNIQFRVSRDGFHYRRILFTIHGKMEKISRFIINLRIEPSIPQVTQRHCRKPFHVRKDVEAELKRLKEIDVIEDVTGPTSWLSPVVIVPKKNG